MTPKKSNPCVGCGYCCITAPCILSVSLSLTDRAGNCAALFWTGERYLCALVESDSRFKRELAIGAGCCSSLNTWRNDVKKRSRSDDYEQGLLWARDVGPEAWEKVRQSAQIKGYDSVRHYLECLTQFSGERISGMIDGMGETK